MLTSSIAIVGAGLSGLVLARILQINGIPTTVYEGDAGAETRRQGGQLDIHDDSGQQALRAAGLHEEFLRRTHPQAEYVRVLDQHARIHLDAPGEGGRPEIDRTALRDLLIGADGTWSRVRPLLSDAVPAYSGITHIEIHVPTRNPGRPQSSAPA